MCRFLKLSFSHADVSASPLSSIADFRHSQSCTLHDDHCPHLWSPCCYCPPWERFPIGIAYTSSPRESRLLIRCMHLPMNFLYFIKYFAVEKCPKINDLPSEDERPCHPQNETDWLRADVKRCKSLEQTLFTATKFQ